MATVPLTILLATEANGLRPQPGELICALIKPVFFTFTFKEKFSVLF